MNPLPLFLIIVSLPLLLGGCGEKPVADVKPVEEKVLEVKDEAKTEEPLAETKPELEGVNKKELEPREDIVYLKGSDTPYTGKFFLLHENRQKAGEGNFKDGKMDGSWVYWYEDGQKNTELNYKDGEQDGLWTEWHENGQKAYEGNYKDGKIISSKYWNSKGEPVDTWQESQK